MVTYGTKQRPLAATVVGVLAVLGAAGSAVMTLAHLGLDVPLIAGPGRLLLPVAIGFAVGMALYVLVAVGAFRVTRWAFAVGLAVNALAFLSAAFPYRGPVSAAAMTVSGMAVAVLHLTGSTPPFGGLPTRRYRRLRPCRLLL